MNKMALVTGGAGFIGSNLIERLIFEDYKVVCIDNFDSFYSEDDKYDNLKNVVASSQFILIKGDIRDKTIVNQIFVDYKIDIVVHLAAKAGVRPSILNQKEYYDVNVVGTINLLEIMKDNNVKKLIFSSSSSVYGNNKKIPYSENDNVDYPISPYAATKKAGELITYTFHDLYNFDVLNLRFFTVYGPRQRPDLAIHKFFKSIYTNVPISIYGDGSTSRDYTFIDDTIQGIFSAVKYLELNQRVYEIINLGNYNPIKLNELISNIEMVAERKFQIEYLPMQAGDVELTYANIDKAKMILKYQPQTNLMTGLKQFQDWFLKNKITIE